MRFLFTATILTTLALAGCQSHPENSSSEVRVRTPSAPPAAGAELYRRQEVIYARPFGTALTMEVFTPRQGANGAAIILALSEGWHSDRGLIAKNIPLYIEPLLRGGYTVFAVVHGSNPKFALPENIQDLHRAARFIRHHAARYGVDPDRIGSTGDSAGGHLSLMLGCAGQPGEAEAEDSVDRASSQVQAVVAFFPPTDFLNWGVAGKRMLGQHPQVPLQGAFAFTRFDAASSSFQLLTDPQEREAVGRLVSPISHVTRHDAPTLLVVGDADELIPPQQSHRMAARLRQAGVTSRLITRPGGGHDAATVQAHMPDALAWFNRYLTRK